MIRLADNGLAVLDLKAAMRAHVEWVIDYCGGDVTWAARELGVNTTTVWRWRRAWSLGCRVSDLRPKLVVEERERAEA